MAKFRTPKEMSAREERRPLSARVTVPTYEALEKAAKISGNPLSLFVANVLDDYVSWLKEQARK
jgi:uncharacterized protein (DUF1778 family)